MAKVMLIDATHPEETRVAVADGRKLEEFDVEVASRRPLKGNIYLAKVTRVEPSLQAAFVEYGGNRHGFLAFSEIHPDYYRIPVADRERLLREAARDDDDEDDVDASTGRRARFDDHDEDDGDAMAAAESSATEASFEDEPVRRRRRGRAERGWRIGQHLAARQRDAFDLDRARRRGPTRSRRGNRSGRWPRSIGERLSALPPRADELVSPWEQPEGGSGSAALETPRFELRSAPVDDITTAAPASAGQQRRCRS